MNITADKTRINVHLTRELKNDIEETAKKYQTSTGSLVRNAIIQYLDNLTASSVG